MRAKSARLTRPSLLHVNITCRESGVSYIVATRPVRSDHIYEQVLIDPESFVKLYELLVEYGSAESLIGGEDVQVIRLEGNQNLVVAGFAADDFFRDDEALAGVRGVLAGVSVESADREPLRGLLSCLKLRAQ